MDRLQAALRLTGVGFFIGISIAGGAFLGLWLDTKLNTSPLLVLTGLFLGLFVAGYGVYKMLLPLLSGNDARRKKG